MSQKETFATIPNTLLIRKDLSHGAKLCAARLIQYAAAGKVAYPRLPTLADELGMSVTAVKRFLNELVDKNLIRPRRRGQGRSNEYYLAAELLTHKAGFHSPKVGYQERPKPAPLESPKAGHPSIYNKRKEEKERQEDAHKLGEIAAMLMGKVGVES